MSTLRTARLAAAVLAVAACAKKDQVATDSAATRVDSTTTAAAATTDSAAGSVANNATNGAWAPANVLGFATVANMGEIEEGKLAESKATNPAVKAFAKQMVADHETMLKDGKALGGKLNATADTTTGAAHDLLGDGRDELKDLQNKAAGADWDEDFINKEIDGHKKVLDKLQDAAKNTTDADLKTMLEKATGKVQEHLTKAQDIKANVLKK